MFFEKQGVVKLTDFGKNYFMEKLNELIVFFSQGFSNRFSPGTKLLTSCGSLAYSAPEILLGDPYDAPAIGKFELLKIDVFIFLFAFRYLEFRCNIIHARYWSSTIPRSQ